MWVLMYVFPYSVSPPATNDRGQNGAFPRARFVSSRTGCIAAELNDLWHRRIRPAAVPPMQVPLAAAMALLDLAPARG
jgi:hypothetical protein